MAINYKFKAGDFVTLTKHFPDSYGRLNWCDEMFSYVGLTVLLENKADEESLSDDQGHALWKIAGCHWREVSMILYNHKQGTSLTPVNDYLCVCKRYCSRTDKVCWCCGSKIIP